MSELENVAAPEAVATDTPAPVTEAPQTPVEADEPSLTDILSEAYDKATREVARGPDGKFVSTKEPEAVEEASDDAAPAEQVEDQTSPEAETVEPAKPAIDPPTSWSREMRDKWSTLPPEAQEYIARRESEAHTQISRLGQQVKSFEPIAKTLEQYRGTFEFNGMDYAKGLEALLAAQSMLDTNPKAAILEIARAYDVDLFGTSDPVKRAEDFQRRQDGELPTRDVLALQAKIAQLERQIAETRTDVVSRKEQERQAREAALQSEIDAFAKANPYFSELEADIAALIPVLRSQSPELSERQLLERAYQKAARINDNVFAKIEAERKAKEAEEARKKAAEAKKVASLNVKTTTTAKPAARDWVDDLAAAYDRAQSRAS